MPRDAEPFRIPRDPSGTVFPWKPRRASWTPKLVAIGGSGLAFAWMLTSLRLEVRIPERIAPRKGEVIYLDDSPESLALEVRGREGGPFPSRFDPSEWGPVAALEQPVMAALQFRPPPYAPPPAELPSAPTAPHAPTTGRGEAVFPDRRPPAPPPAAVAVKPVPMLYPLSGLTRDRLPATLPPFTPPAPDAGPARATAPRFLLRLHPDGSVADSFPLDPGSDPALTAWIRQVRFAPPAAAGNWIAVAVALTNQPADGTAPH